MVKILRHRLKQTRHRAVIDARVRAALVASLYSSPLSLAIGAACGLLSSLFIGYSSGRSEIIALAYVLTAVVAGRIWTAIVFNRVAKDEDSSSPRLELVYEAGAWAYAGLLGMVAALTVLLADDVRLHTLAVTNAIGYAAGISGRNAGRPIIAVGQLALATVPVLTGLFLEGSTAYMILGIISILFWTAMFSITMRTFDVVHASFDAAHRNAKLAREMRSFATTDSVTGLANRAGLDDWMAKTMTGGDTDPFALFWFDLDRFKEVNDTLGHPVGDRLLAEVANRLRSVCEPGSIISRFGGDEFVVACPNMDRKTASSFGELMLTVIAQPVQIEGQSISISASLGIALYPDDGQSAAVLMQQADMALYASKVDGRGCQNFFDPAMDRELTRRRELESELRGAIRAGELQLHYQPIVDLGTGKITSMEALVRWFHPERGKLSPDEFIAIAEATGLIITMGNWITLEACKTAATWPDDVCVAVNVSPVQMQAPGAALGFISAVKASGLAPHRLELEITENVFADKTANVVEFIRMIRDAGIGLTLDDFGTGYSSLSYIRDFDFSKIKIDRSFVSDLAVGDRGAAIVMAVADLARRLSMPVVAEGIETPDNARLVRALGCSHGQGFFYSAAVPKDDALAMLTRAGGKAKAA